MPTWYEGVVALLVAIGGAGGLVQLVKAIRSWREGVSQREAAPTAKLVAYLEIRVTTLEAKVDSAELYIDLLRAEMSAAGLPVPRRPAYGGSTTT